MSTLDTNRRHSRGLNSIGASYGHRSNGIAILKRINKLPNPMSEPCRPRELLMPRSLCPMHARCSKIYNIPQHVISLISHIRTYLSFPSPTPSLSINSLPNRPSPLPAHPTTPQPSYTPPPPPPTTIPIPNPHNPLHTLQLPQNPSHPLNPPHRPLQPLQPPPLIPLAPLQLPDPLLQPRPRPPLRRHHLVGLLEQAGAELLHLAAGLVETAFGFGAEGLFPREGG